MEWQLQTAKAKFSELVQMATEEGPQTVTRRGTPAVGDRRHCPGPRISSGSWDVRGIEQTGVSYLDPFALR
jgi:hypothetical protein